MNELWLGPAPLAVERGPATRLYVLLGDPVEHSWSPRLHDAAFHATGLDARYLACAIPAAALPQAVADLRRHAAAGVVAGANVTIPHKRAMAQRVDTADAVAELCGAVNTVCIRRHGDGVALHGLNTDAGGLQQALSAAGVELAGSRLVVLGAGGMARAAVAAACMAGAAEIRIAARSVPQAQDIFDAIAARWPGALPAMACVPWAGAAQALAGADIAVHATPLGLNPGDALPCTFDHAPAALFVQDTVYGRGTTAWVRAAQAHGLRAADGREVLLQQAAAAFTAWTERVAPLAAMRASLPARGAN
jgi:shikimate dehydrogenase